MPVEVPPKFAEVLISFFQNAGETQPIYYNEVTSKLYLDGEDREFWIGNLFTEFQRSKAESYENFFSDAWKIWCIVQDDLPDRPKWIPEIIYPLRDETHPLSYHVEEVPDTDLWTVSAPFDVMPSAECYDLVGAYNVWWSNQFQRACKKHLYNIYKWLISGQINEDELCVLSELRRMWRQGLLGATSSKLNIVQEIAFLGEKSKIPHVLKQLLDELKVTLGSHENATQAFRQLQANCK